MKEKYDFLPCYNFTIDYLYGLFLKFFFKKSILTEEQFEMIKIIEKRAYPKQMIMYCYQNNISEFLKSVGCSNIYQIDFLLEDGYYLLCARHYNCIEILDFASETKKCKYVFRIVNFLKKNYSKKTIYMRARESTSYQILKKFEKCGKIIFCNDYIKSSSEEVWHFIKMKIS